MYHFPQVNTRLGIPLSPDADEIAEAVARQTGSRIAPSGALAANRLVLSTQVPAKSVYLTLRYLGRSAVDNEAIARLRRGLSQQQKKELLRDARYTTGWIADVVRQIATEKPEAVVHG